MSQFHVYRASAGSGKTFILAKTFLKYSLDGDDSDILHKFKRILALTFTNKACEEMKQRILGVCSRISQGEIETEPMANVLIDELNIDQSTLVYRCKILISAMIHQYSDISIMTIDSFSYGIVRSFAREMGLPANVNVNLNIFERLRQMLVFVFADANESNPDLLKALKSLVDQRLAIGKRWDFESDIINLMYQLLADDSFLPLHGLQQLSGDDLRAIREAIHQHHDSLIVKVKQLASNACKLIEDANVSENACHYGRRGFYGYFYKLKDDVTVKNILPTKTTKTTMSDDTWCKKTASKEETAKIYSISDELKDIFKNIHKLSSDFILTNLSLSPMVLMMLLHQCMQALKKIETTEQSVLISDINQRVLNLVLTTSIPYIYERVGAVYDHYLIDEFQDTSLFQWHNILPLIENSLSTNYGCMLVGDPKQAIYRWRGGEVELIGQLPNIYLGDDISGVPKVHYPIVSDQFVDHRLTTNYRSSQTVIEFNNHLFQSIKKHLPKIHHHLFDDCIQLPANTDQGYVKISQSADLEQVVNDIKHIYDNRKYSFSDMCVLVRTNNEVRQVSDFLLSHGIKIHSKFSTRLIDDPCVQVVMSYLKWISNEESSLIGFQLLVKVFQCRNKRSPNASDCIYLKSIVDNFQLRDVFSKWNIIVPENVPFHNVSFTLLELYKSLATSGIDLDTLGVQTLLSIAHHASQSTQFHDVKMFLAMWNDSASTFSMPSSATDDCVNIMTVHQSKGLEFSVVFLPFLDWKFTSSREFLWSRIRSLNIPELKSMPILLPRRNALIDTNLSDIYEKEENVSVLDTFNVLYVALTRAKYRMYLYCDSSIQKKSMGSVLTSYFNSLDMCEIGDEDILGNRESEFVTTANIEKETEFFWQLQWQKILEVSNDSQENRDAANRGIILHEILSCVTHLSDVSSSIERIGKKYSLDIDIKNDFTERIVQSISLNEIAHYFSDEYEIFFEHTILLPTGKTYIPDRLMKQRDTGEWALLDYKTGDEDLRHVTQVRQYISLLIEMGYTVKDAWLLYVDIPYAKRVTIK